ncbi:hypothetical protein Droror1_Dr00025860 [Drosera rotundifolia]
MWDWCRPDCAGEGLDALWSSWSWIFAAGGDWSSSPSSKRCPFMRDLSNYVTQGDGSTQVFVLDAKWLKEKGESMNDGLEIELAKPWCWYDQCLRDQTIGSFGKEWWFSTRP